MPIRFTPTTHLIFAVDKDTGLLHKSHTVEERPDGTSVYSTKPVPFVAAHKDNWYEYPLVPDAIVIHFTAAGAASGSITWFKTGHDERMKHGVTGASSAHLVIDRDGSVTQMVPFNKVAYHAGDGKLAGKNPNFCAIGIELANRGPLAPESRGCVVFLGAHKHPLVRGTRWEDYDPRQLEAVFGIGRALCFTYGIQAARIVGHDDVAPKIKCDPGPAFPMDDFRNYCSKQGE